MENTIDKPMDGETQDEWKSAPYHSSIMPAELPAELQPKAEPLRDEAPAPMRNETKLGLGVLCAALIAGSLGDALWRAEPWGINVLVWTAGMMAAVTMLIRRQRLQLPRGLKWVAVPMLCFAAGAAWRDSEALRLLDLAALLMTLALASFYMRTGRLFAAGVMEYAQGIAYAAVFSTGGALALVFNDIRWRELPRGGWSKQALAVGRGVALAFPLLLVFGGLFMAADAAFENLVQNTFKIDVVWIFSHLMLTGFLTWIIGGFLRSALLTSNTVLPLDKRPASLALGITETSIVLGLMNLLFLAFVAVQFRYFFGGAAHVAASMGLTYAEYARRGFFELVIVAALVLPLLLGAHWLLRKENPAHERIFRALAVMQLLLLGVIMFSAVQRMRLYQSEYGMTELRLYTTAFMGWLVIVFVWFALTVLRGQRMRFAFGAIVTGCVMIGALHALNPDALIVRVNAERASAGRGFDVDYAASLSADAVPTLVAALPALNEADRRAVMERLHRRWPLSQSSEPAGWRSWNWSRARARSVMRGK